MFDIQVSFHQFMFKPFKFWADYSDSEWEEWSQGLPENCFEKLEIPAEPKIEKTNKLQIFTPMIQQNLNDMTLSPVLSEESRKQKILEIRRRSSTSSNSDGSLTPPSPMMMRKLSFDKFKPIMSPRPRRKS